MTLRVCRDGFFDGLNEQADADVFSSISMVEGLNGSCIYLVSHV